MRAKCAAGSFGALLTVLVLASVTAPREAHAIFACDYIVGVDLANATCINTGIDTDAPFTRDQTGPYDLTVINSGSSNGIQATSVDGNLLVNNAGSISGDVSATTSGIGNVNVVNSGTITAVNSIQIGSNAGVASLYNSGAIYGPVSVTGGAATASAVITNAGVIDGRSIAGNFAISLAVNSATGAASTLNILPGSRIFGFILLAGGGGSPATSVNIRSGGDISSTLIFGTCACGGGLTDTGSTVNVFGGAPYVVSGNTVAVLDPTSFAVGDRNVLDVTHAITSLVSGRLNSPAQAGVGAGGAAIGFAPSGNVASDMAREAFAGISSLNYASNDRVLFNSPSAMTEDGTSIWAQGFGGQRVQKASAPTLRSVNNFYGGTIGIDKAMTPQWLVGCFVGAGAVKSALDYNSGDTKSDIGFGGLYGRYAMSRSFLDFSLLGGHTSNDLRRTIANNFALNGYEFAAASYDGWFVSPEIAYGVRQQLAKDVTLTPVARLRYLAANFGSYQESGSTTNLTVAGRTTHNFEERAELTLARSVALTPASQLQLSGTAGFLALQRAGDSTVTTVLLGQTLAFATPGKNNVVGFTAGSGLDWRRADGISLFAAMELTAMSDSSRTLTGKGGVRVAF